MKIVVLSKCFFSEKHVARLKRLGKVLFYSDTRSETEAVKRLRGAAIAVANGMICPFTDQVFGNAKELRLLVLNSTGFDFVDLKAARKHKIRVANLPGYASEAVAEHVFALLFSVSRNILWLNGKMRNSRFQINPAVGQNLKLLAHNLHGRTLGILGYGSIGQRVAKLGLGMGMNVIVNSRTRRAVPRDIRWVSKSEILRKSDVISLHLPLSKQTSGIIGRSELQVIKPGAILINTARGGLIDETALYDALKTKRLLGAGLDVLSHSASTNRLLKLKNVVFTPHSAWWTTDSLQNQAESIVQIIENYTHKKPVSFVI